MRKVVVMTNLTLDGVMQAPGRADEDRRDGFEHGGWATPFAPRGRRFGRRGQAQEGTGQGFLIMGSGLLVQSLMRRNLVDDYLLLIHPLVLGSGRCLFTDGGAFAALQLVDSKTTPNGVVIATYRPAEPTAKPVSH